MNVVKVGRVWPIGTHFKKENIFLATVVYSEEYKRTVLRRNLGEEIYQSETFEELLKAFRDDQYELFYKDESGYTCFHTYGVDTLTADNSDGKGILKNITPVWQYYAENQLKEAMVEGCDLVIMVHDALPLHRYRVDCEQGNN